MKKLLLLISLCLFSSDANANSQNFPFDVADIENICDSLQVKVQASKDISLIEAGLDKWTAIARKVCKLPIKYPKYETDPAQSEGFTNEYTLLILEANALPSHTDKRILSVYTNVTEYWWDGDSKTYAINTIYSSGMTEKGIAQFYGEIVQKSKTNLKKTIERWRKSLSF